VVLDVGGGADDSLLFTAEEDEAHGAAGRTTEGFDGAGYVDNRRDSGAVVLGSGGGMPGVEVGADDDDLVGKIATRDLGYYVIDLSCGADAVLECELDGDWAFIEEALDEQLVFGTNLGDGEVRKGAVEGEGGGGFDAIGAAADEQGLWDEVTKVS
jgi:hypothetical protein